MKKKQIKKTRYMGFIIENDTYSYLACETYIIMKYGKTFSILGFSNLKYLNLFYSLYIY